MDNLHANKKILFVATVNSHILRFHLPYLQLLHNSGYEVHVCTGEKGNIPYCDKKIEINIERSPYKLKNIIGIHDLRKIIDKEKYQIIHCHTPMGGLVARLAAKNARKRYNTRVIYTAHGFHFYKGASLFNWLIYYPIEKWMTKYTDTLITINKEDYELGRKKFKKIKSIEYVYGVGLDIHKFDIKMSEEELENLRTNIGIKKENKILTYVAELNKNKNQILLIELMKKLIKNDDNYVLLLVGDGNLKTYYQRYIETHKLEANIKLLGVRQDIPRILNITNIYVASSLREGLPVNILEAMYMGLPIIATNNRGHRELIENGKNGFIIRNDIEMKEKIEELDEKTIEKWYKNNQQKIKQYELVNVIEHMKKIYEI